jgi:hypothetical protein
MIDTLAPWIFSNLDRRRFCGTGASTEGHERSSNAARYALQRASKHLSLLP